jgi:hypothetical protein
LLDWWRGNARRMRTMFAVYLVFIFGAIGVYAIVGLEHL